MLALAAALTLVAQPAGPPEFAPDRELRPAPVAKLAGTKTASQAIFGGPGLPFTTHTRDSLWDKPSEFVREFGPVKTDAARGGLAVAVEAGGVVYGCEECRLGEAARRLERPLGTAPIHRLRRVTPVYSHGYTPTGFGGKGAGIDASAGVPGSPDCRPRGRVGTAGGFGAELDAQYQSSTQRVAGDYPPGKLFDVGGGPFGSATTITRCVLSRSGDWPEVGAEVARLDAAGRADTPKR